MTCQYFDGNDSLLLYIYSQTQVTCFKYRPSILRHLTLNKVTKIRKYEVRGGTGTMWSPINYSMGMWSSMHRHRRNDIHIAALPHVLCFLALRCFIYKQTWFYSQQWETICSRCKAIIWILPCCWHHPVTSSHAAMRRSRHSSDHAGLVQLSRQGAHISPTVINRKWAIPVDQSMTSGTLNSTS